MGNTTISHEGYIEAVKTDCVQVRIINASACSACHAKGACSASDMEEKIIDAIKDNNTYFIGEKVIVTTQESKGWQALFLGYVLPFVIVLITLIVCTVLNMSEVQSGILSLGTLIPYYSILYLFRNTIKKNFEFTIQKINH